MLGRGELQAQMARVALQQAKDSACKVGRRHIHTQNVCFVGRMHWKENVDYVRPQPTHFFQAAIETVLMTSLQTRIFDACVRCLVCNVFVFF